jgi:mono/diheme cytochrome c family protein
MSANALVRNAGVIKCAPRACMCQQIRSSEQSMSPTTARASTGSDARRRRRIVLKHLTALPLLFGCTGLPLPPVSSDCRPTRSRASATLPALPSSTWPAPSTTSQGWRLDEAVQAVPKPEYLALKIPTGPRWSASRRSCGRNFVAAWLEVRGAVGTAPRGAAAGGSRCALCHIPGAVRGCRRGAAAPPLASVLPAGDATTLGRLSALPTLPRADFLASLTEGEMSRQDCNKGRRGGFGFGL